MTTSFSYQTIEEAPVSHRRVIQFSISGELTEHQVAEAAGLSTREVYEIKQYPVVRNHIELLRSDKAVALMELADDYNDLIPKAVKALSDLLDNADGISPHAALKAIQVAFEHDPGGRFVKQTKHKRVEEHHVGFHNGNIDELKELRHQIFSQVGRPALEAIGVSPEEIEEACEPDQKLSS